MMDMCSNRSVALGLSAADVPEGTAVMRSTPETNVFVCHDKDGLYVVDAGCTHLGCDVSFVDAASGFSCMCHGATYDFNGQNPTSPAPSPLPHYLVCAQPSGTLTVDVDMIVDPKVRLKP